MASTISAGFSLFSVLIVALFLVAALWAIGIYNGLIAARNQYKNAFAQIDVQLTRRHDLVPNLLETVKGYLQHERATLEAVVAARNAAVSGLKQAQSQPGDPAAMRELAGLENQFGATLGRLFALSEAYPELKANQNMMQFSEELSSTENKVAFARQAFNDAITAYNNRREAFPGNILANAFGFNAAALLEIEDAAKRAVPTVAFT